MTDYPQKEKTTPKPNWKNKRGSRKWRDIFAVLIVFLLSVVILKGILGAFNFGQIKTPSWDGQAPIAVFLNTKPASFVVFNKNSHKLALFAIDDEVKFPTGNAQEPLVGVGDINSAGQEEENMKLVAGYLGADIQNYVFLKESLVLDKTSFEKLFGRFSSLGTPLAILTKGLGDVSQTSLRRFDLLSLWWQIKDLSVSDLVYLDSANYTEDFVVGDKTKVKGLDVELFRSELSKYFENSKLTVGKKRVFVENNSGVKGAGTIAGQILTLAGFDVANVETKDGKAQKSSILVKNKGGYAQEYLAKIFNCDINAQNTAEEDTITVIIGRDFAKRYL